MKKFINILLICIIANCAYADTAVNNTTQQKKPTVYQIDIVAFKNIEGLKAIPEQQWLPYQSMSFDNAIPLQNTSEIPSIEPDNGNFYEALAPSQFVLTADANRIKRSTLYNFLTEQSWRQPIIINQPTSTVLITAGTNFSNDPSSPIWELTGTVKLTASYYQYLNLAVNFYLVEPSSDSDSLMMLNITEKRRIIANQLNYIDSPGLGLLIKVVPVLNKPVAAERARLEKLQI